MHLDCIFGQTIALGPTAAAFKTYSLSKMPQPSYPPPKNLNFSQKILILLRSKRPYLATTTLPLWIFLKL
ncbi:TPA: hypothetical protein DDZ86_05285 [Candidatus Dependentiae bacterium]|nr:hypothetical protein [Candidatus Dependentiae bacterium]